MSRFPISLTAVGVSIMEPGMLHRCTRKSPRRTRPVVRTGNGPVVLVERPNFGPNRVIGPEDCPEITFDWPVF